MRNITNKYCINHYALLCYKNDREIPHNLACNLTICSKNRLWFINIYIVVIFIFILYIKNILMTINNTLNKLLIYFLSVCRRLW